LAHLKRETRLQYRDYFANETKLDQLSSADCLHRMHNHYSMTIDQ